MRFALFSLLALIFVVSAAEAQSVSESLPPFAAANEPEKTPTPPPAPSPTPSAVPPAVVVTDPYTVTDVNADVTADSAAHARDQALMQAERDAFTQLCTRMGAAEGAAKLDDNALAALVQSFEVQSEHVSPVRYIGVFTIRFKPLSVQKKIGKSAAPVPADAADASAAPAVVIEGKPMPQGPLSDVLIGVQADSLASWMQIKRRLNAVPQVARINTLDLGRGLSHIDVAYSGSILDLQQALIAQGLVLRQTPTGIWELYDGSMVTR
jgi:hypothetical protein